MKLVAVVRSSMLMADPSQASNPQGQCVVRCAVLVDNVPGTDPGWQQSKSNWTLLAVTGQSARMLVTMQSVTTSFFSFLC